MLLGRASSTSVRVHDGEVESFTSADTSGAGVRVIRDGRVGFAHCGSLDPDVLLATLDEAADNATFGEVDEFNALVSPDGVAPVRRDAWSPAVLELPVESKIELALDLERRVLAADPRIRGARTTAFGDSWGESAIVSTSGIVGFDRGASCSVATQPMAEADGETQIGFAHDATRDPAELDLDRVVAEAADRATRLLGARSPASARLTIVLEPRLAITLLGVVSGMLAGDSVAKGRSPFAERRGEVIAVPVGHAGGRPDAARVARVRGDRRRGSRVSRQRVDRPRRAGRLPARRLRRSSDRQRVDRVSGARHPEPARGGSAGPGDGARVPQR